MKGSIRPVTGQLTIGQVVGKTYRFSPDLDSKPLKGRTPAGKTLLNDRETIDTALKESAHECHIYSERGEEGTVGGGQVNKSQDQGSKQSGASCI